MEEEFDVAGDGLKILQTSETVDTFFVSMTEEFKDINYYLPLKSVLDSTGSGDVVTILLNSNGGDLTTALTVSQWIKEANATVVAQLGPENSSAATMIPLFCDFVEVGRWSSFMIHSVCYQTGRDTQKRISDFVNFSDKYLKDVFTDVYNGFLTKEEIDNIIDNSKEMWMGPKEIYERMLKVKGENVIC